MTYPDRYLLFIEYFNKGKFMSAQTTLDVIWLDDRTPDRNFYGGLIQLAVCFYHLTNDNPKGAIKIFESAREMLASYGDDVHLGISLRKLITECDALYEEKVKPDDSSMDYTKMIPKIEFTSESN